MNIIRKVSDKIYWGIIKRLKQRITQRIDKVEYYFDCLKCEDGRLFINGWIFSAKNEMDSIMIVLYKGKERKQIPVRLFRREDVINSYQLHGESRCGFWMEAEYQTDCDLKIILQYRMFEKIREIHLIDAVPNASDGGLQVTENVLKPYDNQDVLYYWDQCVCKRQNISMRGWIFSLTSSLDSLCMVFHTADEEKEIPIHFFKRIDVEKAFKLRDGYCGFHIDLDFLCDRDMSVFLQYCVNGKTERIYISHVHANSKEKGISITQNQCLSYQEFEQLYLTEKSVVSDKTKDEKIDIIVPVYNGFDFLEGLFSSIEQTKMSYRLYIVNDNSTDERVLPFLREYARDREEVCLLENDENLGFVQSVNRALEMTDNHVVLVNTDVLLPDLWLERLISPILDNRAVATSTPFTNSGTICSFPVFCENNDIYLDMDVKEIDRCFASIIPPYRELPTGVGFCMAMNKNALKEVGLLDAETFYKGYGEENDWCLRAIAKGYRNVQVENLFVWHKHGGSFLSEDKQKYIERNLKIITERYPEYEMEVGNFCLKDPNRQIREYVALRLIFSVAREFVVIFNHNWGGGASEYMKNRIDEMLQEGKGTVEIVEDAELGLMCIVSYLKEETVFYAHSYDELYDVIKQLTCQNIFINELVSFENVQKVQELILRLKDIYHARITMLCHDFYAVCPSIYLLNDGKHCFLPEKEKCEECYRNNQDKMNQEYETIGQWRELWASFLEKCDEVITFSENTKTYYERCYRQIPYSVVPHKVDYMEPVEAYRKTTDIVTIGVIGNLMPAKGSDIIYRMADIIAERGINARIVAIGSVLVSDIDENVIMHGRYEREELPKLMREYEVDIVFIASICPETFSYTTEEAMMMGMKVASFDIGAPAERLKKYDKGIIIKEMTAECALKTIMEEVKSRG